MRIDWDTVGRIFTRVMDDRLDPNRLEYLFEIGVDEVSWRKRHNHLTLVFNHRTNHVVGRPAAVICYDPFHVVALATKALDVVRRQVWNDMRALDAAAAKRFKGARWARLKNPSDLTTTRPPP